ncbi:hypothetical protein CALCODRAFT_536221 [Calocera cornea HHB12733]|uniref:Concanavalin A-like lectin/glucanase n=1 Tax=Calocera cornea HHB12733 TaxID=1353952 RepID=A0A165HSI1_9BASI|nr:hypothetical protein CALCODRAFT_536221 [Calocera cornea HHB12733]
MLVRTLLCSLVGAGIWLPVRATPIELVKRLEDFPIAAALLSAYDTTMDVFASFGGNLVVPQMAVPSGGDPLQAWSAQCSVGGANGCLGMYPHPGLPMNSATHTSLAALYEYAPDYESAVFQLSISPGDLLIFTSTIVNNKTVSISCLDESSGDSASVTLTSSAVQPAPYTQIIWGIEQASAGLVDFGVVDWTQTAVTTKSGVRLTPADTDEIWELVYGGVQHSSVTPSTAEVSIAYQP